jgi:hypothetical protein
MKAWEDVDAALTARAEALVDAAKGTKEIKALGAWLDESGDVALRGAILELAAKREVELPEDAVDWPGKKLIRRARGREASSQVRTTPIARDEDFACLFCRREVPRHGRTARDHCPFCLRSLHVDDVPGDRANPCSGRMDPFEVVLRDREIVLRYQCSRCRVEKQVRAVLDGDVPDDWDALCKLSAGVLGT